MKVVLSGIYSDISGRHGSTVASKNKSGLYLKPFVPPYTSNISRNVAVRGKFNSLAILWKTLSSTRHTDWNTKALTYTFKDRFGNPYVPNGYQLFLYCNLNLSNVTNTPLLDPSVYAPVPYPYASIDPVYKGAATWNFNFAVSIPANHFFLLYVSKLQSPGFFGVNPPVNIFDSQFYTHAFPINYYSLLSTWFNNHFPVDYKLFCSVYLLNQLSGCVSLPQFATRPILS